MTDGRERDATRATSGEKYRAVVERYRDEPNRCTIFPEETDEDDRTTTWVTAKEPSFVDLWSVR